MTTISTSLDSDDMDQAQTVIVGSASAGGRLIQPGSLLDDQYLVKEMLGQGGMGCVFKAEHTIMKKDYAIKILSASQIDQQSLRRFEVEGRVIARLDHPAIVKVHDMGVDKGDCPFYVMDLLLGVPLSDLCGPVWRGSINDTLRLFRDIADGFAYAHGKGIIHRDIKPSNIILVADAQDTVQAKIVDFGIAKELNTTFAGQSQTKIGEIFGSPLYMSPEQSRGQPCDVRTDIYSLGCTLFEVLTGTTPFKGASFLETLMLHQDAPAPSLGQTAPDRDFSVALEQLVAKMLAKNPGLRYQSMSQVIHDLDRILAGKAVGRSALEQPGRDSRESSADHHTRPHFDKRMQLALAGTVMLIAATVAWSLMSPKEANTNSKMIMAINRATALKNTEVTNLKRQDGDEIDKALDANQVDLVDKKSIEILKNAPIIKSEPVDYNGKKYRRLVLPSVTIGEVFAGTKYIKPRLIRPSGAEIMFPAQTLNAGIVIAARRHIVAFFNPGIYKKIGKEEFTALQFDCLLPEELFLANPDAAQQQILSAADILHAAVGWTQLRELTLENLSLKDIRVRRELDSFSHLRTLELVKTSDVPVAYLVASPVLKGLKDFSMLSSGPVEKVIDRLLGDGSVTTLRFDGKWMSAGLVKKLDRYNKIESLELSNQPPPDAVLKEAGQIRSLKRLRISRSWITDALITELCQNKNIVLILDRGVFSDQDMVRLQSTSVRFE